MTDSSKRVWQDGVAATGDKDDIGNARDYLTALREGKFGVIHTIGGYSFGGDCTDDPLCLAEALKISLESARVDASALDPTGRKTKEQMEDEVDRTIHDAYIAYARRKFASASRTDGTDYVYLPEPFQSMRELMGDTYPDQARDLSDVRRALEFGGLDASVLDATGKRSAAEMEQQIRDVDKQVDIRDARRDLQMMKDGLLTDDGFLRENLERAGVDASALDPTGKHSATEMEAAILVATREGNLIAARELLKDATMLETSGHTDEARDFRRMMNERLAVAGMGVEAIADASLPTGAPDSPKARQRPSPSEKSPPTP